MKHNPFDLTRSLVKNIRSGLNRPWRIPVYCYRGAIFERQSGATVKIGHRLHLGARVSYLSEAKACVRIRRNASFEVDGFATLGPGVITIVNDGAHLRIGHNTYIAADSKVYASNEITIGSDCALAWNLTIIDSDFHIVEVGGDPRPMCAPIRIGNHVWVGSNVTILKGVTIGDGAVVAAGSVVTRNIPPGCLAAGSPARVVREAVTWKP